MPMFGSISRGKSGMASALEKEDVAALKGTKSKEDADHGATCSDPCYDESTSRETSPQRSPSNLRTRECFALLFGVEVAPTIEDGVGSHILPTYVWTECIIFDILSPTIEDISQVMILNPMECLVFRGCHSRGEGFTYSEALALSNIYHQETTTWIGHRVKMHCVMHTLRDARGDLRMVRDQEHDKTLERIRHQYQENEEDGQSTPTCYFIAILLRGSSRNNQNEGREDAWWMRETTTAKAENKVMRAGMRSPAEIDLRVCMPIVRPQRGPHEGIP